MKRLDMMSGIGIALAAILLAVAAHEAFAASPFINPELGDVKLFAFVSVGTVTGFIFGYHWRRLSGGRRAGRQTR